MKAQIHMRENGDVVVVNPPEFKAPSINDHAVALRDQGRKGTPLHDSADRLAARDPEIVLQVLEDHALLALEILEAIHSNDHKLLRNLADALKKESKPKIDRINQAVARAARKAGREPTVEEVMVTSGNYRSDHLKDQLKARGHHLKKEVLRGDTLNRPQI